MRNVNGYSYHHREAEGSREALPSLSSAIRYKKKGSYEDGKEPGCHTNQFLIFMVACPWRDTTEGVHPVLGLPQGQKYIMLLRKLLCSASPELHIIVACCDINESKP